MSPYHRYRFFVPLLQSPVNAICQFPAYEVVAAPFDVFPPERRRPAEQQQHSRASTSFTIQRHRRGDNCSGLTQLVESGQGSCVC